MANVNDTSTSTANDLQPRGTPERTRSVLECVVLWILEENLVRCPHRRVELKDSDLF